MKNLAFLLTTWMLVSSCNTPMETKHSKNLAISGKLLMPQSKVNFTIKNLSTKNYELVLNYYIEVNIGDKTHRFVKRNTSQKQTLSSKNKSYAPQYKSLVSGGNFQETIDLANFIEDTGKKESLLGKLNKEQVFVIVIPYREGPGGSDYGVLRLSLTR